MVDLTPKRIFNLIPGTLTYKGKVVSGFAIDLIGYDNGEVFRESFDSVEAYSAFVNGIRGEKVLWLNVTGLNNVDQVGALGDLYEMPRNIREQIVNVSRQSNYRITPDWIYNDLQMIYLKGERVEFEHISIYLKGNMVITFQEMEGDIFDSVRQRILEGLGHIRMRKGDYLYYSLVDALVDGYRDVMEKVKYDINCLEDDIIDEKKIDAKDIHSLRKTILVLRMTTSTMDRLLAQIVSKSLYVFPSTDQHHLDSLNDHNKDLVNELILQREVVNALFENHMLNNSNDMNTIMTTLTIFSAIFIPLSFLAGIFGMNFLYMPGLDYIHGFGLFIGICLAIVVAMVSLFKIKKWF